MKKMKLTICVMAALAGFQPAFAQQATPVQPTLQPVAQQPVLSPVAVPQPAQMSPEQLQALQAQYQAQQQQVAQQAAMQQAYGTAGFPVQQPVYAPQTFPQVAQPVIAQPVVGTPSAPPSALPPLPSDFELAVQQSGFTPKEIRALRSVNDERQRASIEMPNPPKSVTGSISLSLDPGSTPSIIRPFYGVATSLVILDSTGATWPVENFSVGNQSLFRLDRLDGDAGSSFVIVPLQPYGQSNIILKLKGHPTPVVINLILGQKTHDARVEARVLGRGPNAQINSVALTPGVDSRLLSVLDGVPPSGRALTVSGDAASKAWVMPDGNIWLRTALTVVSPAPLSFVSSSDGTRVYKLSPSAKVLGMINGQFLTLDLSGCLQECGGGSSSIGW